MLTTVGTSSLVAEKFGSGRTEVLALHGWGRNGADFARILAPHNGLALHLPGFVPGPEPPQPGPVPTTPEKSPKH